MRAENKNQENTIVITNIATTTITIKFIISAIAIITNIIYRLINYTLAYTTMTFIDI
jgi:hypothetical protein